MDHPHVTVLNEKVRGRMVVEFVSMREMEVQGTTVLVRVDLNVPLRDDGSIADDTRIRQILPTVEYLRQKEARVVLISHLGRPKGRRVHRFSLKPVAKRLAELLKTEVGLTREVVGDEPRQAIDQLGPGDVLLLENVRFHPGEEANAPEFAKALAELGDLIINDAFAASHREHASIVGVARYRPVVAGLLLEKEITALKALRDQPEHPYMAIIGGAKISDKLAICRRLLDKVDAMMLGGGLANTFIACMGYAVGQSLCEMEIANDVRNLIAEASRKNVDLLMPLDVMIAPTMDAAAPTRIVDVGDVPNDWMIVDIGPRTVGRYTAKLQQAKTVFWNGPMGVFEIPGFSSGTRSIAEALAELKDATKVAGGGESVEALQQMDLLAQMDHVSTGGGASLEFLSGRLLPGIRVLKRKEIDRKPWVGGNWKMAVSPEQAQDFAASFSEKMLANDLDVVLFPSFTEIEPVSQMLKQRSVLVGGQDCHWEARGSFTGGVSAHMLRWVGASYAIVGHSEFREHFADTDERVAKKLFRALEAELSAVLCVGETSAERDAGRAKERISEQLHRALKEVRDRMPEDYVWSNRLVVAYEPVWAIGAKKPAETEQIAEMMRYIRKQLAEILTPPAAEGIRIVYGGSVNAKNVASVMAISDVDGVLVGGASQKVEEFVTLLEQVASAD